jgi:isoquinoline 1-oxidoreductase alpha subunit
MSLTLQINGQARPLAPDLDPSTPLLWVLRDHLGLLGTKYGCGQGLCGACTIHLNGAPLRSCVFPVAAAVGQRITTVEGLAQDEKLTALQQAWCDEDVAQCGYCQGGQIMTATALLASNSRPSDADIDAACAGNLCRCGTYVRIRRAIHTAAEVQAAPAQA